MRQLDTFSRDGPDLFRVLFVDDVVEVVAECFFICGRVGDALAEVENEGGEAGGREVDFLVVGYLADCAVGLSMVALLVGSDGEWFI